MEPDITMQSKINNTQKENHDSSHIQDLLDHQKNDKIKEDTLGIREGKKVKGDKNHDREKMIKYIVYMDVSS